MVDIIAHGAISYLLFGLKRRTKEALLAVFFGIMPDLFSRAIYLIYSIIIGGTNFMDIYFGEIPTWSTLLHGLTHSLVVFGLVILIVYLIFKKIPIYLYAWGLHILIDIPTHARDFLPTPFLWPISNWQFPGISWYASGWFIFVYWIIIALAFVYFLMISSHKKTDF